jgi:hypothetical protein
MKERERSIMQMEENKCRKDVEKRMHYHIASKYVFEINQAVLPWVL